MLLASPKPRLSAGASHVYDVIVVGGQLGGALSAALLAKRGYRVLLIEHDGLGAGYAHDGYLLPYAPFVAPPLKTMAVVDEAFVELGLSTVLQRTLKPHLPSLQLVLPHQRADLHSVEARRLKELTREFGAVGASLNKRLKAAAVQHELTDWFFKLRPCLPPSGLLEAWGLRRLVRNHPGIQEAPAIEGDDAPTALLAKLSPFLSHLVSPDHPLGRTRPLSQVLKAPSMLPGSKEAMRELLCRKLTDLGGELLGAGSAEGSIVESLSFEGEKLAGVKIVGSDALYRGSSLVAAIDAGALRRLVSDKQKHKKLVHMCDGVTTHSFLYAVNWVVDLAGLPMGMGDLVLMDSEDPELGPLLIQTGPARRADGKPPSESLRVLCAGAFVPAASRNLGEAGLQRLSARIGGHLERLMPFAREHVLLRSAPYLDAGGARGSRLSPHPLYRVDGKVFLGITGLRQRTPVKNLLLASREVLPGLGLEGEFLAGIRAARMVQDMMKKRILLKR